MKPTDTLTTLFSHNLWANLRLLERCAKLSDEQLSTSIAGTYGYKTEKYQIGMDVGRPVFEQVQANGSPVAVCDSETCRWQIGAATGAKMLHPVELLAQAYGLNS